MLAFYFRLGEWRGLAWGRWKSFAASRSIQYEVNGSVERLVDNDVRKKSWGRRLNVNSSYLHSLHRALLNRSYITGGQLHYAHSRRRAMRTLHCQLINLLCLSVRIITETLIQSDTSSDKLGSLLENWKHNVECRHSALKHYFTLFYNTPSIYWWSF